MTKSVKQQFKNLEREFRKIAKDQIPFAASQALNDIAFKANAAVKAQAATKLDRPTKFTIKGFQVKKATKKSLRSAVFIESKRVPYMRYQIFGGIRKVSGKGTGVPVNQKLNKFGNIPGRKKGLIKNKNQFIATINGIGGVWQRKRKSISLITAFETKTEYDAIFPMEKIVIGVSRSLFAKAMKFRFAQAMKTRRR